MNLKSAVKRVVRNLGMFCLHFNNCSLPENIITHNGQKFNRKLEEIHILDRNVLFNRRFPAPFGV